MTGERLTLQQVTWFITLLVIKSYRLKRPQSVICLGCTKNGSLFYSWKLKKRLSFLVLPKQVFGPSYFVGALYCLIFQVLLYSTIPACLLLTSQLCICPNGCAEKLLSSVYMVHGMYNFGAQVLEKLLWLVCNLFEKQVKHLFQ